MLCSPHLQVSAFLVLLAWVVRNETYGFIDNALSILPSLLGFTIGAMAIVLAVAPSSVFVLLAQRGNPASFFMKMTANFLHYIIVQVIGILLALIFSGSESNLAGLVVGFVMIYAITVSVAIGTQLFQMARIYNKHASLRAANTTPEE